MKVNTCIFSSIIYSVILSPTPIYTSPPHTHTHLGARALAVRGVLQKMRGVGRLHSVCIYQCDAMDCTDGLLCLRRPTSAGTVYRRRLRELGYVHMPRDLCLELQSACSAPNSATATTGISLLGSPRQLHGAAAKRACAGVGHGGQYAKSRYHRYCRCHRWWQCNSRDVHC